MSENVSNNQITFTLGGDTSQYWVPEYMTQSFLPNPGAFRPGLVECDYAPDEDGYETLSNPPGCVSPQDDVIIVINHGQGTFFWHMAHWDEDDYCWKDDSEENDWSMEQVKFYITLPHAKTVWDSFHGGSNE